MTRTQVAAGTLAALLALGLTACGDNGTAEDTATGGDPKVDAADVAGPDDTPTGDARIDFTLPDLDGADQTFNQWDGDLVVLNFWATWCPPCKKEMPLFQETWEEHRDEDFNIVAVAVDELSATEQFVATYGIEFPILIGQDEAMEVQAEYGNRIGALPYTVVIDRDGTVRETHRGEVTEDDLDGWLEAYL
ncbi:TlpA disulfide reductase family protein [Thioalkalivibrio sp. ALJ24]|uniref:TlpA family protein disulfide reductase n=1 Tax=Thioalkalivibrio sp. ALJ24 TaxID=545276 RepID=UPI00037D1B94|nr:TlpA disulfide reductase family protein [Thioalkalivibrio sp. ALJ24]